VQPIYVTGHRNPDTDSIASAIGYAELKQQLNPDEQYIPVRLGECNIQTQWVLKRSGAPKPEFLPHVLLRAGDVMTTDFPSVDEDAPIREAGRSIARANLDVVPVVGKDGALIGVVTERALARRYIRESRQTSTLRDAPTFIDAIVRVLEGELVAGSNRQLSGRVWVHAMSVNATSGISDGDAVVIGDRTDAQLVAIDLGASLIVLSNGARPTAEVIASATARGATVVISPLDTYVSARMITLAAPCRAFMEQNPLTVALDDLVNDIAESVKDIHYGTAVAIDDDGRPVGLLTRSDLVGPTPRRVILVDHAESAQSVPGVEQAEIVEILDHHHIGSIETRVPVTATFDPVGSTATLVTERFTDHGIEPTRETAMALLCAVMSDTVILNSATTTARDHAVVRFLERLLAVDGRELGQEMFKQTSDVSQVSAEAIVARDAKRYQVRGGQEICIAQVEVVGKSLLERKDELLSAMRTVRDGDDLHLYALMVTDVLSKGTDLLVSGDVAGVARAFGVTVQDSTIELPGVMSRKKEVAPKLLQTL
jgi:manganese-dependent inorganic pyrophosphatase